MEGMTDHPPKPAQRGLWLLGMGRVWPGMGLGYLGTGLLKVTIASAFISSGLIKLSQPASFAGVIGQYVNAPWWAVDTVALCLPVAEVLLGIAVFWSALVVWALSALMALTLFFISLISWALAAGLEIPCGCFGAGETISLTTLWRDVALLSGEGVVLWNVLRRRGARKDGRSSSWASP